MTILCSINSMVMLLIVMFLKQIIFILDNLPYNKSEFSTFFSYLVSNRDAQIKILLNMLLIVAIEF